MTDDRIDRLVDNGVADYHTPPGEVPRDELWQRIQAARRTGIRHDTRLARRVWIWPSAAAAAVILIAVGVIVGRRMERSVPAAARVIAAAKPDTSRPDARAYRLVLLQHMAGVEAMITAFRTSAKAGTMDKRIAGWSQELLSTTRMLESSAAADDPVMQRLLVDLDLVLTQIARYTGTGSYHPEELDVIEHSITKRGVISKLRSTLPGRAASAGL
jgi:hypothetical protein